MAVLTRNKIIERIKEGSLGFEPGLDRFQLGAHSVDMRMGFTFMVPRPWHMTKKGREALNIEYYGPTGPKQKQQKSYYEILELEQGQHFDILPQEHIIVSTLESVKMPDDLMAILFPRSSVNRRGLSVDLSGIIDAGYEGQLIIPITNSTYQTIRLYPGERFCQVVFEELTERTRAVQSRFHKQDVIKGFVPEKSSQEKTFIRSGDIRKLKDKFRIA